MPCASGVAHNATNALAALALSCACGCALGPVLYGLREYRGEPHRVESVGIINEVEFFDDSKGTNVGATVAALSGSGADRKLIVILGGEGKGAGFLAAGRASGSLCARGGLDGSGCAADSHGAGESGVPLADADSMAQAVLLANAKAHVGDAVLMSPACASFDV